MLRQGGVVLRQGWGGGVVLRRRRGVEAGVGRRDVEAGGSGVEAEEGC